MTMFDRELSDLSQDWRHWRAAERIGAMLLATALIGVPAVMYIAMRAG